MDKLSRAHHLGRAPGLALILGIVLSLPMAASWQQVYKYSTYIGGDDVDDVSAVGSGPDGTTYFAGMTWSSDFQWTHTVCGPPELEPVPRLFVLALDASGRFLYSSCIQTTTFPEWPDPAAVSVASDGSVLVAYNLTTFSTRHGLGRAFAARLSPEGELVYRRGLEVPGGLARAQAIAVDDDANAYVAGSIQRSGWFRDHAAFIMKLTPDGMISAQVYLDGGGSDEATAILRDPAGALFLTGNTESPDLFRSLPGQPRRPFAGGLDAFVLKLDPTDGKFAFFTYLGGSGVDRAAAIALSSTNDNLLVAGDSNSEDFPLAPQLPKTYGHTIEFLTRLSPGGDPLGATWLGRAGTPSTAPPQAIALDGDGSLYWTGYAGTLRPIGNPDFSCEGSDFAKLDPETLEVVRSTCLWMAFGPDLTMGPDGYPVVAGWTYGGPSLPMVNAMDPVFEDWMEGFAMKLILNQVPDCSAAAAIPSALWPPNGKLVPVAIAGVTDPDGDPITVTFTGARQDEPLSRRGGDVTGLGTPTAMVRADRLGGDDGRIYHLDFEARDRHGSTCTGRVTVCVPHDQKEESCGDGGPIFASTGG